MSACLAEDVEFFSPVAFKPFVSKPVVAALLGFVGDTFEDFVYLFLFLYETFICIQWRII